MGKTIVTGKVRWSYTNLLAPRAMEGQEPKYSVTLLIPKSDTATKAAIDRALEEAIQEGVASKFGGVRPLKIATPLYDGDGERPSGDPFGPECAGHWVMTASSKQKPQVVDADVQPIMDPSEIYSGCYGRVSLRFYAYNQSGKKGVGCGLQNAQKLADGEPLGGGTTAVQDFGAADTTGPAVDPITGLPRY